MTTCTKCNGTGEYNYPPERCWACGGKGYLEPVKCGPCNGTGKTTFMVPGWDPKDEVPEEKYIEQTCSSCGGSGSIER